MHNDVAYKKDKVFCLFTPLIITSLSHPTSIFFFFLLSFSLFFSYTPILESPPLFFAIHISIFFKANQQKENIQQ